MRVMNSEILFKFLLNGILFLSNFKLCCKYWKDGKDDHMKNKKFKRMNYYYYYYYFVYNLFLKNITSKFQKLVEREYVIFF